MEAVQTIYVKNMVCHRCILMVNHIISRLQISFNKIMLGKIEIRERLDERKYQALTRELSDVGLELIESRVTKMVEEIKLALLEYMDLGVDCQQYKLSSFISAKLHYDFSYLSDVFSSSEGVSIERYFILRRIDKVKQLLLNDELSISEISYTTGFSSVHHLSAQFKKITGLTPTQFKQELSSSPHRINLS